MLNLTTMGVLAHHRKSGCRPDLCSKYSCRSCRGGLKVVALFTTVTSRVSPWSKPKQKFVPNS